MQYESRKKLMATSVHICVPRQNLVHVAKIFIGGRNVSDLCDVPQILTPSMSSLGFYHSLAVPLEF